MTTANTILYASGPGAVGDTGSKLPPQGFPDLPSWQIQQLNSLAESGQLSGVPPQVLALIAKAESGGQGGSINSSGYGGFFGLAPNQNYSGNSVTTSQLQGTDVNSFSAQAITAAGLFRSLLNQFGGNPVAAEYAYQNGPNAGPGGTTEGASLFQQFGLTGTVPGGSVSQLVGGNQSEAQLTAATTSSGSGTDSQSSQGTNAARIFADLDSLLNASGTLGVLNPIEDAKIIIARGAIVFGGLILFTAGLVLIVEAVGGTGRKAVSGAVSASGTIGSTAKGVAATAAKVAA